MKYAGVCRERDELLNNTFGKQLSRLLTALRTVELLRLSVVLLPRATCAVRLVSNTRKYDRGLTYIRRNVLHWLDVTDRVCFRVCIQVFKCLHGMALDYLSTMCHPVSRLPGHQNLRSANRRQLDVPRVTLSVFEPSHTLVHLCGTLCPFISRTAI